MDHLELHNDLIKLEAVAVAHNFSMEDRFSLLNTLPSRDQAMLTNGCLGKGVESQVTKE